MKSLCLVHFVVLCLCADFMLMWVQVQLVPAVREAQQQGAGDCSGRDLT